MHPNPKTGIWCSSAPTRMNAVQVLLRVGEIQSVLSAVCSMKCAVCCVRCCKFDSKSLRSNQWGVAPSCQVTCWCPLSATGTLFTSSTSSPICLLNLCSHLILLLPIFTINPFRSQLDNNSLITSSTTSCIHKHMSITHWVRTPLHSTSTSSSIYDSFSDVPESRVWFASKNLTPCRMH